ncbi:hypothetical protein SteCoe_35718 [Stentor coeruleus]|uniref:Phospholipid/glycerol acyltransferase domain-containing protein n=1 Tax=Stentor coeruleus TaxID=5963 RepID=A0A1R2ARN7_9CILI|nr:hypothetical protein SteCoe_35718 [Stentor coeruleus]
MIAWQLRKFLRAVYEKIEVNYEQLNELAKIINNSKIPIVILPSHRSYIDYLVVPYLLFSFGIKMPYIAAAEDFLEISIINKLFKYSGAFCIKHGKNSDSLYKAILTEYIQQLLKDQQVVEFFIEENRSRSGKISQPKVGLLSMCAETFYQGIVPDVKFLPININYDRVLEGETFPFEPLEREKAQESLSRIINSVKILSRNFGKIHIVIGDLISLKDFSTSLELNPVVNEAHRVVVTKKLSQEVVLRLQEKLAIPISTLVASILMMHRNGISEDNLVKKVEWLSDEIKFRGYTVADLDEKNVSIAVRNALNHLGSVIRHKQDTFANIITVESNYQNILMLSYYRNTMHFIFALEAIIAIAIFSFGIKLTLGEGVHKKRLMEEINFLCTLLESEYCLRESICDPESQAKAIEMLIKRGMIEDIEGKYRLIRSGELGINFLCSLIWPLLDTYWIVISFCNSLRNKDPLPYKEFIQGIQPFAENLFGDKSIFYYESQDNINRVVKNFENMKILENSSVGVVFTRDYLKDKVKVQELLDHINKFRKKYPVKMINQHENFKQVLLPEFS